jgi:hypothetical protein
MSPPEPADPNAPANPAEPDDSSAPAEARHACGCALTARNTAATEKLIENVLEDLTGVQARWLGDVKPFFRELLAKAEDSTLTDAEFIAVLEASAKKIPELFGRLNTQALQDAMEGAMGAAAFNGAMQGAMQRRKARRA